MTHVNQIRSKVDKIEDQLLKRWPDSQRLRRFIEEAKRNPSKAFTHEVIEYKGRTKFDPVCDCHECDCDHCTLDTVCEFHEMANNFVKSCLALEKTETTELARLKQESQKSLELINH